ncbi:pyridoxal phosphate-dependent aminotransferase, partial [Providencia heimbachae]
LKADLSFDLEKMEQLANNFGGLSIIYLCNPNNPTAMITPHSQLDKWMSKSSDKQFFIVDEAYAEFVEDPSFVSAIELVKKGQKNLIVTRTFSKIFALAGLRVGYGIASPEVIASVDEFNSIDNTNTAGAFAAIASLNDKSFIAYSLKSNSLSRKIVENALNELGLEYAPSQANFVFHKVKGDMKTYKDRMAEAHIMVGREFPPVVGWNRLTLGTPKEMEQFVIVLKQFREKGWV